MGFVPLLDAAPLIAALENGYFADEGLRVTLARQIGWGNIRDKLTFGQFQAAHALLGMPLFSALGREGFAEPLVSVMSLGSGGNAITFGKRLLEAGVRTAANLAQWVKRRNALSEASYGEHKPIFAHVFGCSMHHYLLRDWLAEGGVNPDQDVRLCVFPPPQMVANLTQGYLDGFCAGEPWNTLAAREGSGAIVALSHDLLPDHPEKVLAVSSRWAAQNASVLPHLIRAVLRGCEFCRQEQNAPALAAMLSDERYLDLDVETLQASLSLGSAASGRACDLGMTHSFPSATHAAWMARQMIRWGHLGAAADVQAIAGRCVNSAPYREAAQSLGIECPATDFPPMRTRLGWFEAATSPEVAQPAPALKSTLLKFSQGVAYEF